jgi:phage terminase large subunit-like protein
VSAQPKPQRIGLVQAASDPRGIGLKPHPSQAELLELIDRNRIVVAACGRRFGKTKAAAAGAIWNLLLTPEADALVSRGERRYALSVANSREQARIFLQHAATLVKNSPTLRHELLDQNANELVFRGNRVLAAMPCTAKSIRGYAASYVVLDEFAHFFDIDEGGPAVAQRVWSALTPSVAQFGEHGRIVAVSTPLGENLFSELYAKAKNGEIPEASAFHAPAWANPMVDASYLTAQEIALGADDYRREFGAEFIAGGSAFLEDSAIRACVGEWRERLPGDGRGWVASFDPSFSRDPAALVLVGNDPVDRDTLIVGHVQRWVPKRRRRGVLRTRQDEDTVIASVLDEVAAVCARFNVMHVVSDQHLPGTVTAELSKRGLSTLIRAWTSSSKTEAFQALRARIYTQRIELPNDPQLIAELGRLRTKLRAGSSAVETPVVGDSHCDLAIALAAGVARLDRGGAPTNWTQEDRIDGRAITDGLLDMDF